MAPRMALFLRGVPVGDDVWAVEGCAGSDDCIGIPLCPNENVAGVNEKLGAGALAGNVKSVEGVGVV